MTSPAPGMRHRGAPADHHRAMPSSAVRRLRLGASVLVFLATAATATTACSSSGPRVAVLGDSITQLSNTELHTALEKSFDADIVGRFGKRSDEVVGDAATMGAADPKVAIVNIGTNDAAQSVPIAQTRAALDRIVSDFDGAKCVFLVEVNEQITSNGTQRVDAVRAINDQLRQIASKNDAVRVIEWNRIEAENGGAAQLTYDTVHLSQKGRIVLADTYLKAAESC